MRPVCHLFLALGVFVSLSSQAMETYQVDLGSSIVKVAEPVSLFGNDPARNQVRLLLKRTNQTPATVRVIWEERFAAYYCAEWSCKGIGTNCENYEKVCVSEKVHDETAVHSVCLRFSGLRSLEDGQSEFFTFGERFSGFVLKSQQTFEKYKIKNGWTDDFRCEGKTPGRTSGWKASVTGKN